MKTYKNIIQFDNIEIILYKKLTLIQSYKLIGDITLPRFYDCKDINNSTISPIILN